MASTSSQVQTSSTSRPTEWDVFISFRGIDTRYTFTDHLYKALQRSGVKTFLDDPELRGGDVISDGLIQAIQDSKIYVVVFSKNYASSRWCLDELVEILNCHKTMNRLIIPVYYDIDPSVVRHQTKSFKGAFKKHESRPRFGLLGRVSDRETAKLAKVKQWRHTLSEIAGFSGQTITAQRSEASIVDEIVDKIVLEMNLKTLHVAEYPVGLDSHVENVTALMSSDTEGVTKIGIYGMGGVGKTTLAKAVYNQNYHRFQGSCFLENVREASVTSRGLVCLQQKLIDSVLKCKNINIDNVNHGSELIRARISSKKVLIVFDDLDDPRSLEFLEGIFALGSIILITTRNEDLLDSINVETRYKVNELGDAESRQLLAQHAFGENMTLDTSTELFKEILEHAGGLPLALKVFGSNLLNQSEESWRHFSDKLKQVSLDVVERKLMISFDALKSVDPMLQDIFLDFACFFIGWNIEEVVKIMETCYMFLGHNVDILKKRCLLTINNRDELGMHDLLRDMGRKIVRNSAPNEPGKHSRLWVSREICDVLKNHSGTEAIKGIISSNFNQQDALEGLSFKSETFKRMSKLRFLKLNKVKLTGSFEQTFGNLRWLCWDSCPLKCLPLEFYPQKLVILELPHSKMRKMWELNKVFKKLKTLNMKHSLHLTTTPNFIQFPHLETLNLEHCESLKEVDMSIGNLERLVFLNLNGCGNLRSLPGIICNLRALKSLNIGGCSSLKELPIELGNLESLEELNAEYLTVVKLPDSIGRLSKLVELKLNYNKNLKTLPDSICNLRALNSLNIGGCSSLEELPKELGKIESLTELNAWGLTVSKLPDSIKCLSKLVVLNLNDNQYLEIPSSSLSAPGSVPTSPDVFLSLREKANVNALIYGNKEASKEGGSGHIAARTFTYHVLAAATRNFRRDCLIMERGDFCVYKGRLESTNQIVAIKKVVQNLEGNKEFLAEVQTLSLLNHSNLVNFIGYCADRDQRLLVYEYMELGSLDHHLHRLSPDKRKLDWSTRMRIAAGAAKGLEYLHHKATPHVIHRDIKCSHILLDKEYNPKLSGFGMAILGPVETHVSTTVSGTFGYIAPEYFQTGHLTRKADVYSFGVVILEIITGRRAVDLLKDVGARHLVDWARERKFFQLADPVLQGQYPVGGLSQALAVAANCVQQEPTLRPHIADVVTNLSYLASQKFDPQVPRSQNFGLGPPLVESKHKISLEDSSVLQIL